MSTQIVNNQTSKRTLDFRRKYKTQKCRYWYQMGFCPYFDVCAFAHTDFELRDRHAINHNYKTKICSNFKNLGFCRYGQRCQFLHIQETFQTCVRTVILLEPFPAISYDKQSISTNEEIVSKHQNDLKLLSDFGLDILGSKKGCRSMRWRSLLEGRECQQSENESKEWSEATRENTEFEQMFPEYNFFKKPRLASI